MPISLIKKNQLDPNIADLVGQYGSGFFLPISVSGNLTGFINNFLENNPAVESINGINGFLNITGVSGINITTGNDPHSIVITYTGVPVSPNLVYSTGQQSIFGSKDFLSGLTISGNSVLTGTEKLQNSGYKLVLNTDGSLFLPNNSEIIDTPQIGDKYVNLDSSDGIRPISNAAILNLGNSPEWGPKIRANPQNYTIIFANGYTSNITSASPIGTIDYGSAWRFNGSWPDSVTLPAIIQSNNYTDNSIFLSPTGLNGGWHFSSNGNIVFPDNSAQNTAYTGIDLSIYATVVNLNSLSGTLTGVYATYSQLTGLSGYEASVTNLLATYAQLTGYSGFEATVDRAFATYSQLTGLSGYDASVANLTSTGSTLLSLINSLSGNLTGNYTKSADFQVAISGVTQIAIGYSMLSAQVYTSGLSGYVSSNFYSANNPSGFITGVDLSSYYPKNNPSGFITGVDLSSYYPKNNPSGFITGVDLSKYLTGVDLSSYYPKNNPSGFITGVDLSAYTLNANTGSFVTVTQTGAFYATNNPSGFITGVDLSSYYPKNNPSGFITGVDLSSYALKSQTGSFVTAAQTGTFYPISNPSGYITGVNLSSYITTGQTGNFYAANNPSGYITGVNLSAYTLNANTGSFVTTAQTGIFATSSNLASTGSALSSQINSLSGNSVLGNGVITNIVSLTQTQFNALTPSSTTVYLIVG